MENPTVLGVDIGGSHITAAIVDLDKGTLIKDSIWILVDKSDYKLQVFYKKKLIRKYLKSFICQHFVFKH